MTRATRYSATHNLNIWRIVMATQKRVQVELTEAQRAKIKAETGKDAQTVELGVEELEERIAPIVING
jgi:hypothetical protein